MEAVKNSADLFLTEDEKAAALNNALYIKQRKFNNAESLSQYHEDAKNTVDFICAAVAACKVDFDRWAELKEDENLDDEDAAELAELEKVRTGAEGSPENEEAARDLILEAPLELLFRSGWADSKDNFTLAEGTLLMYTGGGSGKIIFDIENGSPENARFLFNGWGVPFTEFASNQEQRAALLSFVSNFYFGE